jgi:pimeloyl-ACP methyl ester carboxylesterase
LSGGGLAVASFAVGPMKRSAEEKAKREALAALARIGWEDPDSPIQDLFVSQLLPDGTPEQRRQAADLHRITTSAECAARYMEVTGSLDVSHLVSQITAPTLVMHTRGDLLCPLQAGRDLAAAIPNARFVVLQGRNHVIPEDDPAADRFFEELRLFLG